MVSVPLRTITFFVASDVSFAAIVCVAAISTTSVTPMNEVLIAALPPPNAVATAWTLKMVPSVVAAADIVIVPLKTYIPGAVPSKLYEAMASARPVILVAEGEAAEIVREYQAGIVVRPGDTSGLLRALSTLGSQPALRQRFGANGRRAAELSFDREQIAARFINHLENHL